MSEHTQERVLQALQSAFQAIVAGESYGGGTYNYTPKHVLRFPALTSECLRADADGNVIYVISPDETQINPSTFTDDEAMAAFDISLARRFTPTKGDDPYDPPTEDRLLIQNRLLQDAMGCLAAVNEAQTRPFGITVQIHPRFENRKAEDTYMAGWALAFLRIDVQYDYTRTAP